MISSLVSLHDSCKNRDEIAKGDSWLTLATSHNTLHKQNIIQNITTRLRAKIQKKDTKNIKPQVRIAPSRNHYWSLKRRKHTATLFIELPVKFWSISCIILDWTCIWCCSICEPRGLSNPITMGIKTSKALWVGRGKVVRLQQRLSIIWWLTYEYQNKMSIYANGRKLVVIAKDPELPTS